MKIRTPCNIIAEISPTYFFSFHFSKLIDSSAKSGFTVTWKRQAKVGNIILFFLSFYVNRPSSAGGLKNWNLWQIFSKGILSIAVNKFQSLSFLLLKSLKHLSTFLNCWERCDMWSDIQIDFKVIMLIQ